MNLNVYQGHSCKEYSLTASLYDCIEDNNYRGVKHMLIEKGADPNIILQDTGIAPFHLIIGNESEDFTLKTTKLILQCGGNPNVKSEDGLTPLHIASAWGRLKIVELLIHFGANYEIRDNNYQTPLNYAVEHQHADVAKFLYDEGKTNINFDNADEPKAYCLNLEKILISNGTSEAEYEVNQMEKFASSMSKLDLLPQTTPHEYVSNWFNTNSKTLLCGNQLDDSIKPNQSSTFNRFECSKSPQLKQNSNGGVIELISLQYECSSKFRNVNCPSENNSTKNFCKFKESSRESGILTLSNTSLNAYSISAEKFCDLNLFNRTREHKDTSSDYFTCNEISGSTNILEKNVFDIPEFSISGANCVNNVDPGRMSFNLNEDGGNVSIAEVYKYTDEKEDIVLLEKRFPINQKIEVENELLSQSSKLSSLPASFDYDANTLRHELTQYGFPVGPITKTTKRVYLRKLYKLQKQVAPKILPSISDQLRVYSSELEGTLLTPNCIKDSPECKTLEETLSKEFSNPDPSRKWREGVNKSSFSYLLLDPRLTNNLPNRAEQMPPTEVWKTFLESIFYVGKGKRARPYSHLYDAVKLWNAEAYTREAAMIAALKLENLRNNKLGQFYGTPLTWSAQQQNKLGVALLYKAMMIFLNEGERQLKPSDIN
ncbi:ankyrin repeat and LEM domain-containing protein 1-like isoform X2 [Photinus pyralis]|uniref:ankyrin repeat and LEM domain-containing protein 1-like isoform X2 n=1 Tax=Photinus pyralis TaxID=7054 RepID=UPI001267126D|nr:ankyrin repeat and LEM domain-containing protein 1-like isoform X2 [Photinus pyralis]